MAEGEIETEFLKFANRFMITSHWKPREESPEELGRRTLRCLDAISPLHPAFHGWEFLNLVVDPLEMEDMDPEEYVRPLDEVREQIADVIVDWGVYVDEEGPDPGGGYNISISNSDVVDSQKVTLGAHGGGQVNWTSNRREATFATSFDNEADRTIIAYPIFKSVLMAIISCWDVDYAWAYCRDLAQLWTKSHPFCDLSWMVYLSAPLARRITIPKNITVEHTPDGGILMIAAEVTFDASNPSHVENARRILAALEPLNSEEAKRIESLNTWRPPKSSG